MELQRNCPIHQKELRRFEGISKKTGKPYGNWKCPYRGDKGYCEYIEWDSDEVLTKKFTQTPNGVIETEEIWPTEASVAPKTAPERTETQDSDIRTILARIEGKIDSIKKFITDPQI